MTEKIKRADIKYIAILITLIMIFSSIGILFGNVQIGNAPNTTYNPASNPAGTLALTVEVGGTFYDYFIYSNGSILIAPLDLNGHMYSFYLNETYDGVLSTVLSYTYNTGTQITDGIGGGIWLTNSSSLAGYNLAVHGTPTSLVNISQYSNIYTGQAGTDGYFENVPNGFLYNQEFIFNIGEATSTGGLYLYVPTPVDFYYLQNEVGQTSVITATVSGGTAPFTYQWYVDGSAVSGATSTSYSYSSSSVSQANIICKITDSTGAVQWSEPDFIMTNAHTAISMSGQQRSGFNTADVGQSISFTGAFTYNPYGINKNGILYGTTQFASGTTTAVSGSYTFGSAGSFSIQFYAVDTNGYNATYTMTYTIYSDPVFSALWTSNSVHTNNNIKTTDVNIPIYISSNASLGSGGYSYSWSGTYVSNTNSNTLAYTPTAASTGITITYTLTDSNGWTVSGTINIIVNPDMTIVITTTTTGQ